MFERVLLQVGNDENIEESINSSDFSEGSEQTSYRYQDGKSNASGHHFVCKEKFSLTNLDNEILGG